MARGRGPAAAAGAVLASAAKIRMSKNAGGAAAASSKQRPSWQKDAFGYYDTLGEVWYASQFYSRTLSKLILKPQVINDQGDLEDTDDPLAWDVLDRMQDRGGGRATMLGQYGKLRFLIGEMYLFAHTDPDSGAEVWEILSPFELEFDGRQWIRKTTPKDEGSRYADAGDEEYEPTNDASAVGWRLWVKHPLYSGLADSPMRAVLDECEELLILSHAVRAGARSRIQGNGLLLMPSEISPAPTAKPGAPADDNAANDPFFDDLTQAMVTPIGDEGSASAVVPMLIRGQGELLQYVKHIPLAKPDYLTVQTQQRRECIERIALGVDLPPEILLGVTDANHWTAWQIDEDAWKAHLQPVADAMVLDFTTAYYRPTLQKLGSAMWDRLVIGYDESDVVRRPNKSGDAIRLYDRLEISGESLRREAGFEDDDAPTPEEIQARLDRAAATGIGAVQNVPKQDAPAEGGVPKEKGAPAVENSMDDPGTRVAVTAQLMIDRSRALAGSRIRTRLQKGDCKEWAALVRHVPNELVAHTLAANLGYLPTQVGAPDTLVAGGSEMFITRLVAWGVRREDAEQVGRAAEEHARDRLIDPDTGYLPDEILKIVHLQRMAAV